jgi:hypothetical protein
VPGFDFDLLLQGDCTEPLAVTNIRDLFRYAPEVTADQLIISAWITVSRGYSHECLKISTLLVAEMAE